MKSFHWYPTRSTQTPPPSTGAYLPNALPPEKSHPIDDYALATQVKMALHHPELKSSSLHVETRNGAVQLHGFIESLEDIIRIITVVRPIKAVASVRLTCRLSNSIMKRWF